MDPRKTWLNEALTVSDVNEEALEIMPLSCEICLNERSRETRDVKKTFKTFVITVRNGMGDATRSLNVFMEMESVFSFRICLKDIFVLNVTST